MTTNQKDVRDWMFRRLLFEAETEQFLSAGIRVGTDQSEFERSLLDETLDPFGIDLRDEALRMMRLYALLYCFENSVRFLIRERLHERYGTGWWIEGTTQKIRESAENRQKDAAVNSWLEGEKRDLLGFVDFGHLADIITNNWNDFSDLVPSQHWLRQRFDELEKTRNFIAHHRLLQPGEFQRIEMYVADWNRIVGL